MHRIAIMKLAALTVGIVLLTNPQSARGHVGNNELLSVLCAAGSQQRLAVGSPNVFDSIDGVVQTATTLTGEASPWLLPLGTTLDSTEWLDNVIEIRLTVPKVIDGLWHLSPIDQETIAEAFGQPFLVDDSFGGTRILVRVGQDQPYGSLEQFSIDTPVDSELEPAEQPVVQEADGGAAQLRGPSTHAARQPQGALSGVTVYASAGHGWTAGDTAWFLQRPVLLGMAEDYGNIDQLNYFVQYAFNAGATVVPLRPTGWQPIEIVLDNDDAGVTFTGAWSNGSSSKYYEDGDNVSGIAYKWTSSDAEETAVARYTPDITVTDFYPVFCFTIAGSNRALQTYRVSHSGGISEITIDHRETGNGWIWLGDYYLEAGGDNYVEITNESTVTGAIIADAIRWGCGEGDIWRSGPNSISGYPRDEEAQRYYANNELGNNAVGFDSNIWDIDGSDDQSDNVRTGGKWAREMNVVPAGGVLVDRWKRVHLEFHTNASGGAARGQICLITDLGETTYQEDYATTLSNEVDADMLVMDEEFEHSWVDRSSATYTSSYGAICTGANGDEFDATIVELAFHDNQLDAELLRDARVRDAMGRSCVQGIIRFLHGLPNSEVPLSFAPHTPRYPRAEEQTDGTILISWEPPLSDEARGDPATGYVVYQSGNGYGFGDPIVLGDVLSTSITDLPDGETRYFRIAATNDGGESMPTEVLAVRKSDTYPEKVLIVNGFDRQRRQINPIQTFTQPAGYAGDQIERVMWRKSNSYDYVVQHAEALAAADYSFSSCSNEVIEYSYIQLDDYDIVIWILGTESTEDATLSSNEQNKIADFLYNSRAIFITGAELGYDLIGQGNGASFLQDTLQVDYLSDDAGTFEVTSVAGGCLENIASFDFDPANGAAYETRAPDILAPGADAHACLNYSGGGVAGVQYGNGLYNAVTFGFPFEAISSAADRASVMSQVMEFLRSDHEPFYFNYDDDFDVDMTDFGYMLWCFQGPDVFYPEGHLCVDVAGEEDLDIDLEDFSVLQKAFIGPQ